MFAQLLVLLFILLGNRGAVMLATCTLWRFLTIVIGVEGIVEALWCIEIAFSFKADCTSAIQNCFTWEGELPSLVKLVFVRRCLWWDGSCSGERVSRD